MVHFAFIVTMSPFDFTSVKFILSELACLRGACIRRAEWAQGKLHSSEIELSYVSLLVRVFLCIARRKARKQVGLACYMGLDF